MSDATERLPQGETNGREPGLGYLFDRSGSEPGLTGVELANYLVGHLESDDRGLRSQALERLEGIQTIIDDEVYVGGLVTHCDRLVAELDGLYDSGRHYSAYYTDGLGQELGRVIKLLGDSYNPLAANALVRASQSPYKEIREVSIGALANIGGEVAWNRLVEIVADDGEDVEILWKAREAAVNFGDLGLVEMIRQSLRSDSSRVRSVAAAALVDAGNPEFTSDFRLLLKDENEFVRAAAVEGLGDLEEFESVLVDLVADNSNSVKQQAVNAFEKIKTNTAVEGLLAHLSSENRWVRGYAVEALGYLGNAEAVNHILPLLGDEEWFVRVRAADSLAAIGDSRVVSDLIRALNTAPGDEVVGAAADALGAFSTAEVGQELRRFVAEWEELEGERRDSRRDEQWYRAYWLAIRSLGKVGESEEDVEVLMRVLEKEVRYGARNGEYHQNEAIRAIQEIGTDRAVEELLQMVERGGEHEYLALRALVKINNPVVGERLLACVEQIWRGEREVGRLGNIAEALGELRETRATDKLFSMLEDNRFRTASYGLIKALGYLEDERIAPAVLRFANKHKSAVIEALGRLRAGEGVAWLMRMVETDDGYIRTTAIEALGEIGSTLAVNFLSRVVKYKDVDVRRGGVEALGKIGDEEAVPALVETLGDRSVDVRLEAVVALGKIGGDEALKALEQARRENLSYKVRRAAEKALQGGGDE